jgi:Cys-rich repeat protein
MIPASTIRDSDSKRPEKERTMRRPVKWIGVSLVIAGLALLPAACGGSALGDDSCQQGGHACPTACVSGLGCVECSGDGDCHPGAPFCVLGSCAACSSDGDCGTGQACYPRDHQCHPTCTPNGGHCDPGEPICASDGACVGCQTNDDCGGDRPVCASGTAQCSECGSDSDCGAARPACDLRAGMCVDCLVDSDCGSGFTCDGGNCQASCTSNADCSDPHHPICDTSNGQCVSCMSNSDCGSSAPLCGPMGCVQCLTPGDCHAPTAICGGDGFCVECQNPHDCPNGEKCMHNQCN